MTDLSHHGVKGMHWGVRKEPLSTHRNYTVALQKTDAADFGPKGVDRINARMHEGKTHEQARAAESKRNLYKALAIAGAVAKVLADQGPGIASSIHQRAEFNRGRDAIPAIMSTAAKLKYSKNRGGVYKVTTL
jgi:hypothetical protein